MAGIDMGFSSPTARTRIVSLPSSTTFFAGFDAFVAEHISPGCTVLDIGAGRGWPCPRVQRKAKLVGVDPDRRVKGNPYVESAFQSSIEDMPLVRFDAAMASFVVEHIADVPAFLRAVHARTDTFLFSTPNLHHYFGLTSRALQQLGMQGVALKVLGKDTEYHFDTFYRLNTPTAVFEAGREAGFHRIEIAMFDNPEHLAWYFPWGLRWVPRGYSDIVYKHDWRGIMATMFVRMS